MYSCLSFPLSIFLYCFGSLKYLIARCNRIRPFQFFSIVSQPWNTLQRCITISFQFFSIVSLEVDFNNASLNELTFNFSLLFPYLELYFWSLRSGSFQFFSIVSCSLCVQAHRSLLIYTFNFSLLFLVKQEFKTDTGIEILIFQFFSIVSLGVLDNELVNVLYTFNFSLLFPVVENNFIAKLWIDLSIFLYCFRQKA